MRFYSQAIGFSHLKVQPELEDSLPSSLVWFWQALVLHHMGISIDGSHSVFYNLIWEVSYHHFCHILLVRQTNCGSVWQKRQHRGVDSSRRGSLGPTLEAGCHTNTGRLLHLPPRVQKDRDRTVGIGFSSLTLPKLCPHLFNPGEVQGRLLSATGITRLLSPLPTCWPSEYTSRPWNSSLSRAKLSTVAFVLLFLKDYLIFPYAHIFITKFFLHYRIQLWANSGSNKMISFSCQRLVSTLNSSGM